MIEPVTLAQAKVHVSILDDDGSEDAMLKSMISAARQAAENFTKRNIQPRVVTRSCLGVENGDIVEILPAPFQQLLSVKTIDPNSNDRAATTLVAGTDYLFISESGATTRPSLKIIDNQGKSELLIEMQIGHLRPFAAADVNIADDRITLTNHGFKTWTPSFQLQPGEESGAALPAGLEAGKVYYPKIHDADTIEVTESVGSTTAIDITSQGTGTHILDTTPETIRQAILWSVAGYFEERLPTGGLSEAVKNILYPEKLQQFV